MKFLRLQDPLLLPLYEDQEILAIDKPYGINAHTNDSKVEHSEFIQDGLIEILEKQVQKKLHIIHRLDQTTTGVIIFGKSAEAAKKYSEYFFNREVKKTYWFVTKSHSAKKEVTIDHDIIHKAKELTAKTQFQLLNRSEGLELWQAKPLTGRNHQIRIHAKSAGLPILGDSLYGGAQNSFLCLHNHKIEFPNGLVLTSKPPVYFEDVSLLKNAILSELHFEADRRLRLFSRNTLGNYRMVHQADLSLDQLGQQLILNCGKIFDTQQVQSAYQQFANKMKIKLIINNPQSSTPASKWLAQENNYQFECRTNSGPLVGLHLNQRLQRNWVFQNSSDKSVLHLFASNCGFGLAAAKGNAASVISVEASKKLIEWGQQNFKLNSLSSDQYKFLCRDSLHYLKQARSKMIKFDLIVCEVPSFYKGEKGVFKIERDLNTLLENCLVSLNPEGHLLFSTGFDGFNIVELKQAINDVQKSLKLNLRLSCIQSSLDFELPDQRTTFKSFLIQVTPGDRYVIRNGATQAC